MWIRGEMQVSEAIAQIVKCAIENAIKKQVDGNIYVEVESDGSYVFESPKSDLEKHLNNHIDKQS
jgi:hypothetical protein